MPRDYSFLLSSINMDEFRIQCQLYGFDVEDAVDMLKLAEDKNKFCLCLRGEMVWCNEQGEKVPAPLEFNGDFNISGAPFSSLEGCPQVINGDFDCSASNIMSLKGAPKEVNGNFNFSFTVVKSIDGAPAKVAGYINGVGTPVPAWKYDEYVEIMADPESNISNNNHFDGTGHYRQ